MDNEAEMIEQQMKETREDLTKKLEKLEQQVVETVQNTTSAVTDTVENVKDVIEETVGSVQTAVEDTTEAVRKTFDLRLQVENHPWLMLGGSVAVGFVAGRLLGGLFPAAPTYKSEALPPPSSGGVPTNGGGPSYRSADEAAPPRRQSAAAESEGGGWFGALTKQFAPELDKLKGLALGTAIGLVRDMARQALPGELGGKLSEMLDDVTEKVGGEPFKGPVAPEQSGQEAPPRQGYSRSQPEASGSSSGLGQSGVPPFNRL
jgi:ElaB/YqjD/DUF883 family membrane-anchored ribosome-binding protein